jgi:hypothetical protein
LESPPQIISLSLIEIAVSAEHLPIVHELALNVLCRKRQEMTKREEARIEMFNKIRLYKQSCLSKADFCKKHRIRQSLLHYWQKVHKASNTSAEEHPAFIPIMIDERVATIVRERFIVTGHGVLQVSFPTHATSIPLIRQLLEG